MINKVLNQNKFIKSNNQVFDIFGKSMSGTATYAYIASSRANTAWALFDAGKPSDAADCKLNLKNVFSGCSYQVKIVRLII